jgi:hypothetical protein
MIASGRQRAVAQFCSRYRMAPCTNNSRRRIKSEYADYNLVVGGERASSVRQRYAGKICCECKAPLPLHIEGASGFASAVQVQA